MILRLTRALQMDSKLPAQTSLANVVNWKLIMNYNDKKINFWNKEQGSLKKAKKQEGIAGVVM